MSRKAQSTHWDSMQFERLHREKRIAKIQKIETLRALLEMHEANSDADDHEYVLALRARLRSAEAQYAAMSI